MVSQKVIQRARPVQKVSRKVIHPSQMVSGKLQLVNGRRPSPGPAQRLARRWRPGAACTRGAEPGRQATAGRRFHGPPRHAVMTSHDGDSDKARFPGPAAFRQKSNGPVPSP